ncbi:MAG: ATP-binding protein [Clostridiales bacterium]|nr:ATP-binding protein [Clostridiales bacterium]
MNVIDVVYVFLKILLQFVVELYVFYALVTLKLNRAKYFVLKVVVGFVVVLAAAFCISFFYELYGQTVWGRILVYLFLFGLSTVHVKLCFDEDYKTVLFCCSLAYAAQNLVYKLFLIFWCSGMQIGLFESWRNMYDLYFRLTYYSFYAAITAAIYFLFIRKQNNRLSNGRFDLRMMTVSLLVLCITVILCSLDDVYFGVLSAGAENKYDIYELFVLRQTGNAFSVMCCAIVLTLMSKTVVERNLKTEVEYLQHAVRQGERQYAISKDTIDLINIKCHDIKYKINALFSGDDRPTAAELDDVQESISIYDAQVETGNRILNVLLTEKNLYCEQNGITFSCMADGEKLAFMSAGDLYCLFGNIIDNALEAVGGIAEKERRVINLVVKCKNNMLVIQEDNYFDGELKFLNGLPLTSKQDKDYHGFGTSSIKMIVHKYEGELSASVTDDVFHLNIIIPIIDAEQRATSAK